MTLVPVANLNVTEDVDRLRAEHMELADKVSAPPPDSAQTIDSKRKVASVRAECADIREARPLQKEQRLGIALAVRFERGNTVRKREVIANLLEWASGGEIPVRVADERNVEVIANASEDGKTLIITAIVLRADVIDRLDLMFADEWLDASVEELDADGNWRPFAVEATDERRIRRFSGEFRPGISRIFRLSRRGVGGDSP